MSRDQNPVDKTPRAAHEPATLWEHFVLHKASEKKMMLFDLEIADKKVATNTGHIHNQERKTSALDAATAVAMDERQRSISAPDSSVNTTKTTKSNPTSGPKTTETETKLSPGSLHSHEPVSSPSNPHTSDSTSPTTTSESITLASSHRMTFGPEQQLALAPETLHDETQRQAALVKARPTAGLTIKRRLLADGGVGVRGDEVMMSGALDVEDLRCEVCAARERAMGGLEEAGIVAL